MEFLIIHFFHDIGNHALVGNNLADEVECNLMRSVGQHFDSIRQVIFLMFVIVLVINELFASFFFL